MSTNAPDHQRLFFALWPTQALRLRMAGAAESVLPRAARSVPHQNLHITLAFLGSVDRARRTCLEDCAADVRVPPFTLQLDCSGWFRRTQVIWLGSSETPAALVALAAALRDCQRQCGLEPEQRAFKAHLSLARRARRPPRQRVIEPLVWPVDDFCLVVSETRAEGAVYEVLGRWPLRGP